MGHWIYRGLALLLIGCPCALVISVPAAIASSLSAAARHGMLVKGGAVIEMLARTETVAFDKTGTLTLGEPVVTDVVALDGNEAGLIAQAATIENESSHPLARAIVNHANKAGVTPLPGSEIKAISGRGMQGTVGGKRLFIGAPRFATEVGTVSTELAERISALESEGKTVAVVMAEGGERSLRHARRTAQGCGRRHQGTEGNGYFLAYAVWRQCPHGKGNRQQAGT